MRFAARYRARQPQAASHPPLTAASASQTVPHSGGGRLVGGV
jgi:hypothetical protein